MALVTKQSIVDIYNTRVHDVGKATFTLDSNNSPGSSRIDETKLGPGTFPKPGTAQFSNEPISAAQINAVFYVYARYLTTIRSVRHGYIVDNFNPNTAETTTDDTTENADLIDSSYKNNSLVPASGIANTPTSGTLIDLSDLQSYADNVYARADDSLGLARVDLRICHGSCHNSCHGSRGRR